MELVNVKNISPDKELVLKHDSLGNVTVAPNTERIVPLDVALCNLGNPSARNEGANRARDTEFKQIQTLWGFYSGLEPEEDWHAKKPTAETYDLDGNRIYMLFEDPEGTMAGAFGAARLSEPDNTGLLETRIKALEGQLEQAMKLLTVQTAGDAAQVPNTSSTTPADIPDGVNPASLPLEDQAARNEQAAELPTPTDKPVKKDSPSTTRVGG